MGAYVLTLMLVRRSRDLDRYRYLLLAAGVVLLLLPLVPHFGQNINGARLWVHVGSLRFQPVEIAKIVLCIFFASYFAEKRELLTIPTARFGNRLVLDPRPLVPIVLAWLFAIGVMSLEHDIGFSALLFTLFIGLLWVTTGRTGYLVLGRRAVRHRGLLRRPVPEPDQHPGARTGSTRGSWPTAPGASWSSRGTRWAAGASADRARPGPGRLHCLPTSNADFIFAVIGEEMGLLGSTMVVVAFLLLVGAGLRIAQAARSEFAKLTAVGLTMIIGFQAFFIIGGVLRLLPLTGITLPFVSYGGSALIANYVLIALLMRISDEGGAAADAADQAQWEKSEERRERLLSGG